MAAVTGQKVADFLGQGGDTELVSLAGIHAATVTAFVKAYTRGNGFSAGVPGDDVEQVIITATARLVTNPQQVRNSSIGDLRMGFTVMNGFTMPELAVLNLYRIRAAAV